MLAERRNTTGAPWPLRVVRSRPRLFGSAAVGVVATTALAALTAWRPVTRLLVGWDVGVALYLVLAFHLMAGAQVHHIRRHALLQDEGRFTILMLTVAAALASLAAILAELASPSGSTTR